MPRCANCIYREKIRSGARTYYKCSLDNRFLNYFDSKEGCSSFIKMNKKKHAITKKR